MNHNTRASNNLAAALPALKLLSRSEVADLMSVSLRTVDYLIASGELKSLKIGRAARVRVEAIADYQAAAESRQCQSVRTKRKACR